MALKNTSLSEENLVYLKGIPVSWVKGRLLPYLASFMAKEEMTYRIALGFVYLFIFKRKWAVVCADFQFSFS